MNVSDSSSFFKSTSLIIAKVKARVYLDSVRTAISARSCRATAQRVRQCSRKNGGRGRERLSERDKGDKQTDSELRLRSSEQCFFFFFVCHKPLVFIAPVKINFCF